MSPARRGDLRLVLSEADRRRISAPIRVVWGDDGPFGGPKIAREFVEGFPDATLELVPGVGHAGWWDDDNATRAVRAFLLAR